MTDVDVNKEPVIVSSTQGTNDALMALLRYVIVIVAAVPALIAALRTKDVQQIIDFFHTTQGSGLIAAVIALGTAAYGIYKTHKRGSQVVTIAADSRVPNTVAKVQ